MVLGEGAKEGGVFVIVLHSVYLVDEGNQATVGGLERVDQGEVAGAYKFKLGDGRRRAHMG